MRKDPGYGDFVKVRNVGLLQVLACEAMPCGARRLTMVPVGKLHDPRARRYESVLPPERHIPFGGALTPEGELPS